MTIQELPSYDLQELTDNMVAFFDESEEEIINMLRIVKILSNGDPIPPEQIASDLQLSLDQVSTLLQAQVGTELDKEGNVVGILGLSLVPTPHSFQINGRQLYTWCAADALMYPVIFKSDAIIKSPDPVSGEIVQLTATPEGPRNFDPGNTVVSHVTSIKNFKNARACSCDVTHFFSSVETASQYVSKYQGLVIMPVEKVFQLWKQIVDRKPYNLVFQDH